MLHTRYIILALGISLYVLWGLYSFIDIKKCYKLKKEGKYYFPGFYSFLWLVCHGMVSVILIIGLIAYFW